MLLKAERKVRLADLFRVATAATAEGVKLHVAVHGKGQRNENHICLSVLRQETWCVGDVGREGEDLPELPGANSGADARGAAAKGHSGSTKPREAADHPLLLMGRRPEHKDLIDMTAMVDIVFFLLIFFLVTSMQSIEAVINLPVPQAQAAADSVQAVPDFANDPNYVVVTIDADDAV